ncbi:MAG: system potassium uptake protein [Acidimicrobiia bacterium]|nr:system potassium uptake protein [Acidimicrobiia bacterium]
MRQDQHEGHGRALAGLALGSLGVVFGDIGTSPLYAFREAFHHQHLVVSPTTALGVASVAFWALIVIISVKYIGLVMRADNHGEGGILALTALVLRKSGPGQIALLVQLGVFGTALLYGDGVITPAISVLSAGEGFPVASSAFDDMVLPLACVILTLLFLVQRRGTGGIGKVFGPVMLVWFTVLGVLGLSQILDHPAVLQAVNPVNIVHFFAADPGKAFLTLGSIFLVVTGGEALYADMGHFGRRPIALAWYAVALPGLLLNYFGQAALLLKEPAEVAHPFYGLAPEWAIIPVAALATMATVIASQALISGAFSLTVQATQLEFLPRVRVVHTSRSHSGQVYVPLVNWALMVGSIGLVLAFRTSSNLAGAYGIAVTSTMVITTLLFYAVARSRWNWSRARALLVVIPLFLIDLAFFGANVPKIPHGGWIPLLIAGGLFIQMVTWRRGRELVARALRRGERPIREVLRDHAGVVRVPGTAVFLFRDPDGAPPALISNLRHNKVLHRSTLILGVQTAERPYVPASERLRWADLGDGIHQVVMSFGFMEEPNVPAVLEGVDVPGVKLARDDITYFLGREAVLSTSVPGMHPLLEKLYVVLHRGADSAARFFKLPPESVYEVGTHVEI